MSSDERTDLLISQIVDGDATEAQWAQFTEMVRADATLWRSLGEAQRQHAALETSVNSMIAVADSVEFPQESPQVVPGHRPARSMQTEAPAQRRSPWLLDVMRWSGWAVAAAVVLVAVVRGPQVVPTVPPQPFPEDASSSSPGGMDMPVSTEAARQAYFDAAKADGSMIGQLPPVLWQSKQLENQKVKVIFERRSLEVLVVDDLLQIQGQDETGQPLLIRIHQ